MNSIKIFIESIATREWAILFWLLVLIIWAGRSKSVRESMALVLKSFFNVKILTILGIMTLYVVSLFLFLNAVHLLRFELIKDYLYWYFGFAFVSLFSINIYKQSKSKFKDTIVELLKVSIIIEFLVNFYTFPLLVELVFIPFLFFLYAMIAYSEIKKEYEVVRKFLNGVSILVGLVILVYVSYMTFNNYKSLFIEANLLSLTTPIILSLLFLPFLYLINLYMVYEELFVRITFLLRNTPELISPLKRKIFIKNNINLYSLNFFIEKTRLKLLEVKTSIDVDNLFNE